LPLKQQFFNGRGRLASGALDAVLTDIGDMQEGGAFKSDGYEGALHAGKDSGDAAKVDVSYIALVRVALEMQFLDGAALDQCHACLERGDVDEYVFCHGRR